MVYVVIPVYNRWHYTEACLLALRKQTFQDFRMVVVDDGSTDDTAYNIESAFPEVISLREPGNLFWTAAINIGVRYALENGALHVVTLNNDTLPAPDFLERMYFWSEQYPHAVLGALELDASTGQIIYGGERIDWLRATTKDLLKSLSESGRKGLQTVDWLPGRGLWIPRIAFEQAGLFDQEAFPHYFADLDFTRRAIASGFPNYLNYDARLLTYPEASGDYQHKTRKTLPNYYHHLFGIKGGGNLLNFSRFAFRHCPRFYLPWYWILGSLRRVGGYWK